MLFALLSFGSGFRVQGSRFKVQGSRFRVEVAASPPFLLGDARKWICPAGASFYVADNVLSAGIVSHAWYEILRLSPHLFWLGLFTHRAFSSAHDDDTRGWKGSHLGDMLRVLELAVLYYDTSSPLL